MKNTTTHDPRGGGHPRLIFALGGQALAGSQPRELKLLPGITVIGSGNGRCLIIVRSSQTTAGPMVVAREANFPTSNYKMSHAPGNLRRWRQ
jgi:hypothetical protein